MTLNIRKLGAHIGATVDGVTLTGDLDQATVAAMAPVRNSTISTVKVRLIRFSRTNPRLSCSS